MAFKNGFQLPPGGGELLRLGIDTEQDVQILLIEAGTVGSLLVGIKRDKHIVIGNQGGCTGMNHVKEVASSLTKAILRKLYRVSLGHFGKVPRDVLPCGFFSFQ